MSLASTRLSLTHRATIQRPASTTDTWGHSTGAPVDHLTDLPCRLWAAAGHEAVDAATVAVIEDLRLILTLGTDVTEQDTITTVTFRGDEILGAPAGIRAILRHADHLELVLTRIS